MKRGILALVLSSVLLLTSASSCTSAQVSTAIDIATCVGKLTVTFAHSDNEYVGLALAIGDQVLSFDGCIHLANNVLTTHAAGSSLKPGPITADRARARGLGNSAGDDQLTIYDGVEAPTLTVNAGPVYLTNCSMTQSSNTNFHLTAPWFIDVNGTVYDSLFSADAGTGDAATVAQQVITLKHQGLPALIGQLSTDTYHLSFDRLFPGRTAVIYPQLKATFVVGAYYVGPNANPPSDAASSLPYWAYLASVDVGNAYQDTQYVSGDPEHLCPAA